MSLPIARQVNDALNQQRAKLFEQISERSLAQREAADYLVKSIVKRKIWTPPMTPEPRKPVQQPHPVVPPRSEEEKERDAWDWMTRRVRG